MANQSPEDRALQVRLLQQQLPPKPVGMSEFERRSLRWTKWSTLTSLLGSVLVTVSLLLSGVQTWQLNDTLTSTAFHNIVSQQANFDMLLVEKPEYWGYFHEAQPALPGTSTYTQTMTLAIVKLNVIDATGEQLTYLLDVNSSSPNRDAWYAYVYASFEYSPILCNQLRDNRALYTGWFIPVAQQACITHHGIDIDTLPTQ